MIPLSLDLWLLHQAEKDGDGMRRRSSGAPVCPRDLPQARLAGSWHQNPQIEEVKTIKALITTNVSLFVRIFVRTS